MLRVKQDFFFNNLRNLLVCTKEFESIEAIEAKASLVEFNPHLSQSSNNLLEEQTLSQKEMVLSKKKKWKSKGEYMLQKTKKTIEGKGRWLCIGIIWALSRRQTFVESIHHHVLKCFSRLQNWSSQIDLQWI